MSPSKGQDAAAHLSKLTLDGPRKTAPNKKKQPVADSWEDESSGDEDAAAAAAAGAPDPANAAASSVPASPAPQGPGVKAPPPTPITPSYSADTDPSLPWDSHSSYTHYSSPGQAAAAAGSPDEQRRRPEKTDAVARRMIASALGVKAPRMTEEQRAYDRSVRDQERKRREQEKADEARRREDAERAKAAMWDD